MRIQAVSKRHETSLPLLFTYLIPQVIVEDRKFFPTVANVADQAAVHNLGVCDMRSAHSLLNSPFSPPPLNPISRVPIFKPRHVLHNLHRSVRNCLHSRGNLQPQRATESYPANSVLRLRPAAPRSDSARMRHEPRRLLAHSLRPQRLLSACHLCRRWA